MHLQMNSQIAFELGSISWFWLSLVCKWHCVTNNDITIYILQYNTQADSVRSEPSNPGSPVVGHQRFLVLSRQRGLDNFDVVQRDSSSSEHSDESGSEDSSADSNSSESGDAEKGDESSSDETGIEVHIMDNFYCI